MHLRKITLAATLVGVLLSSTARADRGECQTRLGGGITRMFPWPEVSPRMIESLRHHLNDQRQCVRRVLVEALAQPAPDLVVARIYQPAGLSELRAALRPDWDQPRSKHPLRGGCGGAREVLAATLVDVDDDHLQSEWMAFMALDPVVNVQLIAARTFRAWPDVARRDNFVEAAGLSEGQERTRLLAAKSHLAQLSPPARWRVIKRLVEILEDTDQDIAVALHTFADVELLSRWYADFLKARSIKRALERAADDRTEFPVLDVGDAPRYRAEYAGRALNRIGQTGLRLQIWNEVTRLGGGAGPQAKLARAILAWDAVWTLLERERYDRAFGLVTDEELMLRALRENTLDDRSYEIAKRQRLQVLERPFVPVRTWRINQLEAFERRLSNPL